MHNFEEGNQRSYNHDAAHRPGNGPQLVSSSVMQLAALAAQVGGRWIATVVSVVGLVTALRAFAQVIYRIVSADFWQLLTEPHKPHAPDAERRQPIHLPTPSGKTEKHFHLSTCSFSRLA